MKRRNEFLINKEILTFHNYKTIVKVFKMLRLALGTILIGIGVFAPWLVRDCLDWNADRRVADSVHGVVSSSAPGNESDMDRGSNEQGGTKEGVVEGSTGVAGQSYPVRSRQSASKTILFLQGFLLDSFSSSPASNFSTMRLSASPMSTTHSRSVVSKTADSLRGGLSRIGVRLGDPVFIRVFKEENELELWMKPQGEPDYTLFKVYRIKDWAGAPGPKLREGDGQTPEGFYYISASRMIPDSKHFLAMDLGFPNDYDTYHGRTGKDMLVHGSGRHAGSFALGAANMSEIYTLAQAAMDDGQPFFRVNVFPFRMTDKRMELEWRRQPRWISFWQNLKEGYDFFENVNYPPDVAVQAGKYAFSLH